MSDLQTKSYELFSDFNRAYSGYYREPDNALDEILKCFDDVLHECHLMNDFSVVNNALCLIKRGLEADLEEEGRIIGIKEQEEGQDGLYGSCYLSLLMITAPARSRCPQWHELMSVCNEAAIDRLKESFVDNFPDPIA